MVEALEEERTGQALEEERTRQARSNRPCRIELVGRRRSEVSPDSLRDVQQQQTEERRSEAVKA
eukprot:97581-Hanusia_phi.AAC.1